MRCKTLCVLLASSLTGCGAGGAPSPTRDGAAVFARNCSACHSLIGNESRRRQGGDLASYRLSHEQLLEFTREMPTRTPLTSAQLENVVDYVHAAQQRGHAP